MSLRAVTFTAPDLSGLLNLPRERAEYRYSEVRRPADQKISRIEDEPNLLTPANVFLTRMHGFRV